MFEVVTPPTAEPVTLQEARIHLRQGSDFDSPYVGDSPAVFEEMPDDSWLKTAITAARESCEQFLGFPLTNAVYRLTYTDFTGRTAAEIAQSRFGWNRFEAPPAYLALPRGIYGVQSIQYLDSMNAATTMPTSAYSFDPVSRLLFPTTVWPMVSSRPQAVRLLVRGAYGSDSPPMPVPRAVKQAMLLMIGEWYINREQTIEGRVAETPLGVEYLLRPLRVRLGMA